MLPSILRPRAIDRLSAPISAFESETYDVILQTSPKVENFALYVIVSMIVFAIGFMSLVKLDRVVSGGGKLVPETGAIFVQPLDRAIINAIVVHPGDIVRKGQTLATLDPTFAAADFKQLQEKRQSMAALVGRLQAEQENVPYIAKDPTDPDQALQESIWRQRHAELQQAISDYDSRIGSAAAALRKAQQDLENDHQHLALTTRLADMQQDLIKKGWGSETLAITANDTKVQAERTLEESRNSAAGAAHDLSALEAQKANYVGKWKEDLGVALVTARNDLHDAEEAFAKATKMHDLDRLVAPEDAVVLSIGKASVGSVVDPTGSSQQPLFTLTPLTTPLEAEINVDARDIGFIRKGDHVKLKLDAFTFTAHGTAEGVVESISDGSFTLDDNGQAKAPFYKVKVKITNDKLRHVPKDFRLIPGMTVTGDILIGGRTIMSYIIEAGLRTGSEAMREP